ncbi:hypothetical protein HPB47_012171 [Ixodes persulcatus]|uniref:Uncharacterized protein n=1 Tax=Ixodes persulcatus TaxID=34615 RepID=A0AC60NU79_IXOPE|nr:hypothetical protein HPB47_012171 [Ixodes persulcatus]
MPNSADNALEFNAQSGRTLAPPGLWQQILRERHSLKNPPANPPRFSEPLYIALVGILEVPPEVLDPLSRDFRDALVE